MVAVIILFTVLIQILAFSGFMVANTVASHHARLAEIEASIARMVEVQR